MHIITQNISEADIMVVCCHTILGFKEKTTNWYRELHELNEKGMRPIEHPHWSN